MSKTLQIRDVPDEVHSAVRARAAEADLSVSDYLRDLVSELVTRPTMAEVVERAEALARAGGGASRADVKAAVRDGRDR
ncbi:MAG: FitA-like ribbon-helix-helix domain-containing protein [Nocardioidaceae bacterium]